MKFEDMTVPWSFSRLNAFETCPAQFNALSVAKTHKEIKNDFQTAGTDMHLALERRVMKSEPLPLNWRHLEPAMAKFASAPGEKYGEQKLAINNKFQLTGYFATDVWARSIIDFAIVTPPKALLVDWKNGKRISPDFTQQRVASMFFFIAEPDVQEVTLAYYWTQHAKLTVEKMKRDQLGALVNELRPRLIAYERAHQNKAWPARKNNFCKFCPVKTCEYHP